ncbi:MAG: hypothetical protein WC467_01105 [Patescibacteria group bacterium]
MIVCKKTVGEINLQTSFSEIGLSKEQESAENKVTLCRHYITFDIHEELKVMIEDEEWDNFITVGDLFECVRLKLDKAA